MTMKSFNATIMGVLNVTPDSFSDGGRYLSFDNAIKQAKLMVSQGADVIDIGGESTRPDAIEVSEEDEISRVIPIVKAIRSQLDVDISVDTSKPKVMEYAVAAGANIINDVCALQNNGTLEVMSDSNTKICLMHMQGSPRTMQNNPTYNDVVDDIKSFFDKRLDVCAKAGISRDRIIIDPGFGFGKTLEHNLEILRRFNEFKTFGLPVLAGLSRKSMIGAILGNRDVGIRVIGSVTATIIAVQNGADIVRVHDVLETKDALTVLQSVSGE